MTKYFIAAMFVSLCVATPALATPNVQTCHIDGPAPAGYVKPSEATALPDCVPTANTAAGPHYIGYRIDPMAPNGWSYSPININGTFWFVKNVSNKSYFIPTATMRELSAFMASTVVTGDQASGVGPSVYFYAASIQPPSDAFTAADLCQNGALYTKSSGGSLADGFNVLPTTLATRIEQTYYVRDKSTGELLRVLKATPMPNKWVYHFEADCANANGQQQAAAAAAKPTVVAFDRNATTQDIRVPISDGATVRNITAATPAATPAAAPAKATPVTTVVTAIPASPAATRTSGSTIRVPITDGATVRHIYN